MARKGRYSKQAKHELIDILEYIRNKWSDPSALRFYALFLKKIDLIRENPQRYPKVPGDEVSRILVNSKVTLFYEFNPEEIKILSVFDNRRNPDSLSISGEE